MRSLRPLLLALVLAAPASAQALRHAHPERDAEVPVDGWPTWAEDLTVGSPISDHGSHAGIKAAVTRDGAVPARAFLDQAHYGAFGAVAAQTDQVVVWLDDVATGRAVLAPPDDRRVTFHPWGWEETAVQGDLRAWGAVTTLATDAFLVVARVENHGAQARLLAPRLGVFADAGAHESMHPLHLSWIVHRAADLDAPRNAVVLTHRRGTPFDPFAWDRLDLVRAVGADVPLVRVRSGLGAYAAGSRWARTVEAAPLVVPAGGARAFSFVVGCGQDRRERSIGSRPAAPRPGPTRRRRWRACARAGTPTSTPCPRRTRRAPTRRACTGSPTRACATTATRGAGP